MKNLLLIIVIALCASCKKEPECVTCTVTVKNNNSGNSQTYVESVNTYCNGEADTIRRGEFYFKFTPSNGGSNYIETRKTRECH